MVSSTSLLPAVAADLEALVVVVDRHCQLLLRLLLADDVLVEEAVDLVGRGQRRTGRPSLALLVVGDDVVADIDTLVADEDGRAGDELPDVVLVLVAERATEDLGAFALALHGQTLILLEISSVPAGRSPGPRYHTPSPAPRP